MSENSNSQQDLNQAIKSAEALADRATPTDVELDQEQAATETKAGVLEAAVNAVREDPNVVMLDRKTYDRLIDDRRPLQIEAKTGDDLYRQCKLVSTSSLVGRELQGNPANCYFVAMVGLQLGMKPFQAWMNLNIIKDKISVPTQLLLARILESGLAEWFSEAETTDQFSRWTTRRKSWGSECPECRKQEHSIEMIGEPCPLGCQTVKSFEPLKGKEAKITTAPSLLVAKFREKVFHFAEAEKAGLTRASKSGALSQYQIRPETMLSWRACAALGRMIYPEVNLGLYSEEEAVEIGSSPEAESVSRGTQGVKEALKKRAGNG